MNGIELTDFSEIILTGDIKYLRFLEKNSNKLYLVEYNTKMPLEEIIENISKLKNMEELKKYFNSAYIFEFIEARDLKHHLNKIKEMTSEEKKMLTVIVKEIKSLNISYINFENFFVETQDRKLFYAKLKKTGEPVLKNLKIDLSIKPANIDTIIRDIKTYAAFKYHNLTIKYDDIIEYIDNPLLSPPDELKWIINKIRIYESSRRVQEKVKEEIDNKDNLKTGNTTTKKIDELKSDVALVPDKTIKSKPIVKAKNKKKDGKFKGSLMMYCLIGFTAGVLLAAITIVIDDTMSFGYAALEALKTGSIVICKIPDNIPDWMLDNGELSNSIVWVDNLDEIPDLVANLVAMWVRDDVPEELYNEMEKAAEKHTTSVMKEDVEKVFTEELFAARKKEIQDALDKVVSEASKNNEKSE